MGDFHPFDYLTFDWLQIERCRRLTTLSSRDLRHAFQILVSLAVYGPSLKIDEISVLSSNGSNTSASLRIVNVVRYSQPLTLFTPESI